MRWLGLLFSLAVGLAFAEFASRWIIPESFVMDRRALEPYLMTIGVNDQDAKELEALGPESSGYRDQGNMYAYQGSQLPRTIADRGDALFKHDPLAKQVGGDPLRVFVLGGSVAAGTGSSDEEHTWYRLLEKKLSTALGRPVHVVPGGMSSYVSTQERIALDLYTLPRCPDLVIVLDGVNDASIQGTGARPGDPYNMGMLYTNFYSTGFHVKRWLGKHSRIFRYLVNRSLAREIESANSGLYSHPDAQSRQIGSIVSVYLDNLVRMKRDCDAYGVPCLFFLQPEKSSLQSALKADGQPGDIPTEAYRQIKTALPKASSFGLDLHDLAPAFSDPHALDWFIDSCHFRDPGQTAVAEAMFPLALAGIKKRLTVGNRCFRASIE